MLPLLGLKLVHDRLFGKAEASSGDGNTGPGEGLSDWGTHERGLLQGPIWGYHCGADWGAVQGGAAKEPTDSLDRACLAHDSCWAGCDELPDRNIIKRVHDGRLHQIPARKDCRRNCNFELVASLEALPDDPEDWSEPPAEGTDSRTRRYLKRAINWFKWF